MVKTRLRFLFLLLFFLMFFTAGSVTAFGTETIISTLNNGWNHQLPKIFGDRIVWQDSDPSNSYGIIRLYNITSGIETQVTDNTGYATNPAIWGDFIAYTACSGGPSCNGQISNIFLYDISTGKTAQISSGSDWQDYPALTGNQVVWQDHPLPLSSGYYRIFTSTIPPGTAAEISDPGFDQSNPAAYGNLIAWVNWSTGNPEIYLYNSTSGLSAPVTLPNSGWDEETPAIYDNRIVWQDNRDGNYEIFISGSSPGLEDVVSPGDGSLIPSYPAISGDWVVWSQFNGTAPANLDIFTNDTGTGKTSPVAYNRYSQGTVAPSVSFSPSQSLYRVVWAESDDNGLTYNVHLYTSGTTRTCPVAGFTNDFAGGAAPVTVHFTDASAASATNPVTHWVWDFGDGTGSTDKNPTHTYNANGQYTVTLTAGNSLCRNTTTVTDSVVAGAPVARFSASATNTVVNVPLTFTDSSLGSPTEWDWSWGDGSWTNGTTRVLQHVYTAPGTYSVTLVATNTYGSTATTKSNYITVLPGTSVYANTTITGIAVSTTGSRQFLVYNYTALPVWTLSPDSSVLTFVPPEASGFASISIATSDAGGFVTHDGNTTITGTISAVRLETDEIVPTGFSAATGGPHCSVNYSVNLSSYPENALLNTQIWEGATRSDAINFTTIATGSRFSGTNGTAYTIKITKTNFPSGATATLHMSLNASWVASKPYGRKEVYLERIDDGGTYGQVLGTSYLSHNATTNLDYFKADSPKGLSTFGLSFLEGSGNLFQLVTLTVSGQIVGSGGSGAQSVAVPVTASQTAVIPQPAVSPGATPDPGTTAKLYTNANSVITQATSLVSGDRYATLLIGKGTVANNANGTALSSVSIKRLKASDVPAVTGNKTASFDGMAYDIGPEGATFLPAVTLTFINPRAGWGNVYTIRSYDAATHSWQDLPTAYDPANNTITASVSHLCCYALFAQPVAAAVPPEGSAPATAATLSVAAAATPAPPAPTAMSTFVGLLVWIAGTTYGRLYLAAAAVIVVVVVFFMRRRRQDPLR